MTDAAPVAVSVEAITADPRVQPRVAIVVDTVSEYSEDMERGDKFPPLVVYRDGARYWLADGFHRFYAAAAIGLKEIACEVRAGGLREAVLHSCGTNAAHGLRRTNEDKRRAVAKMLNDEEWAKWSDHEIGRQCVVSHKLVAALRNQVVTRTNPSEGRTYTTKHGTSASMATGRIGPRPSPGLAPDSALIAKCLREIERHLDMMPAEPADAVANFPQDQHFMFPASKLESMAQWLASFAACWRAEIVEKARGTAA